MINQEKINIITNGGKERKLLSIIYEEKDGTNEGEKLVEPYSIRDTGTEKEALFAFDINKGGIRRFIINRILNVAVTNQNFSPRNGWEVEF